MSLIDEIRIAQRNAGEAAVVANLERMGLVDKPNQATPHGTLLEQIMDPCQPKNEREWAALSEIESLRAERDAAVAALKALVARVQTVKIDLDATVAIGEPVPEASASLTWPLSDALLAISAIDAAIAKGEAL